MPDITIVDDGDAAPSSGTGTATHTYTSLASTGPYSFALITWVDASDLTLNSATWGGNACTVYGQSGAVGSGGKRPTTSIVGISGAQTGNLVLNFSAACDDSEVTVVSLANLQSLTAVDTDSDVRLFSDATACDLNGLTTPGVGGIRLAVYCHSTDTSAISWTNATALADLDAGTYRHTAAYDLGDDGTTISNNGATGVSRAIFGVSLAAVSSTAYTLTSAVGAFTLTGVAAILRWDRKVTSAVGAFTFSGVAVAFAWGRSIAVDVGEFILTGIDAGLKAALKIVAEVGIFVLTGVAAALTAIKALVADVGAFTFTGIDAALRTGKNFAADVGEFILTGIDAAFRSGVSLAAGIGTFILTGQSVVFKTGLSLTAAVGSFVLSGIATVLNYIALATAPMEKYAKRRRVKPALNKRRSVTALLTRLRRGH